MQKINKIIDKYKGDEELYKKLKSLYVKDEIFFEEEKRIIDEIKRIITNYYLQTYKFKTYLNNEIQDKLLVSISQLSNLTTKIKETNGEIKIYPLKESNENKKRLYKETIKSMVDYEIKNNINIEEAFDIFAEKINEQLEKLKQKLMEGNMEPYYGSMYYIVMRSLFIIDCIKKIPHININLWKIENVMLQQKAKYLDVRKHRDIEEDFSDVNDEFYSDYNLIESYYKKLLKIENKLFPIIIDKWKKYLTNPQYNKKNYRYIMHCFSEGMVEPDLMKKACCSLYTPSIINETYGNCGLIYDIDIDSLDTLCTDDVGSWITNKEEFISQGCPSRWQLTKLDGDVVFYEYPFNSKLILPKMFEKECMTSIQNNSFQYSEIFLNENAKAVGVFYTEECQNIEEVEEYAKRNGLPVVRMPAYKNNNLDSKKNIF